MGAFVRDLILDEVTVPCPCEGTPHESDIVYIKRSLNGMEYARIQGAMIRVDPQSNSAEASVGEGNMLQVRTFVQDWTFVDENGVKIPYDPELCDYLRSDIWKKVYDETDERMTAAPKAKPIGDTGMPSSTASSPSTSGHSEKSDSSLSSFTDSISVSPMSVSSSKDL